MTEGIIDQNELAYLSYSRMSMYLQCPKQWAYNYIHHAPRTDTVFTMFGTIIHELMEHLALHPECRNVETARELYNSYWQEFKLTDIWFYERGLDMIDKYLDRKNAFAYHVLGTEVQFGQDKDGNGEPMFIGNVPVLGFIDRIDLVDDCTVIVRDYKTNLMPFSNEEVQGHLQMSMYDIVVRKLLPWVQNVILMLDQPAHGEFPSERTDEQREVTTRFIENAWQQMLYDKSHEEKMNQYCQYCPLRTNCVVYNIALAMRVAISDPNDAIALWQEREQLVFQKKAVEGRVGEIDIAIKNMMAGTGQSKMPVQDSEFYFSQQRRKEYPVNKIREIAENAGLGTVVGECLKFEKTKFEKHPAVKGNKALLGAIDKIAIVSYTKPSLCCRKINDATCEECGE